MADRSEKLKHIFLEGSTNRRAFTAHSSPMGPRPPAFPPRADRAGHARSLLHQLRNAEADAQKLQADRAAAQLSECTGITIDVLFVPNDDFSLKSLGDERAGIEVLAVTEVDAQLANATLFVPDGKLSVLEAKVRKYQDTATHRKPKNAPLVSSLEAIRRAAARSYWTDASKPFPEKTGDIWWEVWLRKSVQLEQFRKQAILLGFHVSARQLHFPDRTVLLVRATVEQMTRSAELLDSIAELRSAPPLDLEFLGFDARDEVEFAGDMVQRTLAPIPDSPVVCLLDTGVDDGHPLLARATGPNAIHTCFPPDIRDRYGNGDWHGTGSAGLAIYGLNLATALASPGSWQLSHGLESVKFIPSTGSNDPDLYGEITKTAVALAEIANPSDRRVVVTTMTAQEVKSGEPTSWSAAVDQLCSGFDDEPRQRRLIIVPTGNVLPHSGYTYPSTNEMSPIEDPGQSWNAITVGAYTERVDCGSGATRTWRVVAEQGGLSPTSRTSLTWQRRSKESPSPWKPDFVCEGGNWAQEMEHGYAAEVDALTPLTTRRRDGLGSRLYARFGATSGAASIAANLAAQLQAEYPSIWPETIRALLVHSCRYTPAMASCFSELSKSRKAESMVRCFGYGVPDLERARYSARNELTLVLERTIQPYYLDEQSGTVKTNEMHAHELPWPSELLEQLGHLQTRLRVTLSYFVEPNPGKRGVFGDKGTQIFDQARYPSYGLRFDVLKPGEKIEALLARVNAADWVEDAGRSHDYRGWELGRLRTRGSLHADVWSGSAVELADKGGIVVYPVNGWWRFRRKDPRICERQARYALIVSIETDAEEIDVYTPVLTRITVER